MTSSEWRNTHEEWTRKTQKRIKKDWDRARTRKRTHYTTRLASRHKLRHFPQRIVRSSKHCLGAVQGLNLSSTGRSPGVKILEQPVATLMQRTDHLGRLAGASQIISNPADRRVKVSNSKLRSHSWKKQRRAPGGTRTRTHSSADRPPLIGG